MTKESFVRAVKDCLNAVADIRWNSANEAAVCQLGRRFERGELSTDEAIAALHALFPLARITRETESCLSKSLR